MKISGFIPVYEAGNLKQFQLDGNFKNYPWGAEQADREVLPPMFWPANGNYNISGIVINRINSQGMRRAKDYDSFVDLRSEFESLSVPMDYVEIQLKNGEYYYYTNITERLDTDLDCGYYEIVFTDTEGNAFESDIFFCNGLDRYGTDDVRFDNEIITWDQMIPSFDNDITE